MIISFIPTKSKHLFLCHLKYFIRIMFFEVSLPRAET